MFTLKQPLRVLPKGKNVATNNRPVWILKIWREIRIIQQMATP